MRSETSGHEPNAPTTDDLARSTEDRCQALPDALDGPSWRCDLRAGHSCKHGTLQHLYWAITWDPDESAASS